MNPFKIRLEKILQKAKKLPLESRKSIPPEEIPNLAKMSREINKQSLLCGIPPAIILTLAIMALLSGKTIIGSALMVLGVGALVLSTIKLKKIADQWVEKILTYCEIKLGIMD
ncbi:hypothetical protein KJ575_04080 [Patescibacteria group bacterium]|nr:hypothetical protein [Patescibacteria group bacterium]